MLVFNRLRNHLTLKTAFKLSHDPAERRPQFMRDRGEQVRHELVLLIEIRDLILNRCIIEDQNHHLLILEEGLLDFNMERRRICSDLLIPLFIIFIIFLIIEFAQLRDVLTLVVVILVAAFLLSLLVEFVKHGPGLKDFGLKLDPLFFIASTVL